MSDDGENQEREVKLRELERSVEELKPEHDDTLVKVDNALEHLAAATADLEEVRRIEKLARR